KLAKPYATGEITPLTDNATVLEQFKTWAQKTFPQYELKMPQAFCVGSSYELQGPTGESNQYVVVPRERVLSLADNERDQIQQLLAIFAVGSHAVVLSENTFIAKHLSSMPKAVIDNIKVVKDVVTGDFEAVLHHNNASELLELQKQIASRKGAIVGITHLNSGDYNIPLERFVIERAISINTAAAGGNASLMTMN
ncbi:MAG: trifunctional transcriptional regulator/proline dehydrogenase/L-glutamate gamma-semialdehyde dehydrogenase, partial [Acinetobacter sp.]|nr:trifunctional transcriptional regulator/proline dehydrogenase/L-glutamate gamma-semialdehyde dehydrogenase [Acinetobacter sp.]